MADEKNNPFPSAAELASRYLIREQLRREEMFNAINPSAALILARFATAKTDDEIRQEELDAIRKSREQSRQAKTASLVDDDDAKLGAEYRRRMTEMGEKCQAEAELTAEWWEPYIKEGRELASVCKSKKRAAEIIAKRHPEAGINPGTLRQKL